MDEEAVKRICELHIKLAQEKKTKKSRPRMTPEQKMFAEELYKAHFTPLEASKILYFSYGSIVSLWQSFKYSKIKKYDKINLIIGRNSEEIDELVRAAFVKIKKEGWDFANANS
jgi:hypothetical protein